MLVCSCRERVLRTPWRPDHLLPGSGTRVLSVGRRRCRLGVWNQAKRLHGPRTAEGARITSPDLAPATVASGLRRSGPPEWTWSDRGERSPPEQATGVDLERPGRAVSAGAGHRSGLGATVADNPMKHVTGPHSKVQKKPSLILEERPGSLKTAVLDTRVLVTG